MPEPVPHRPPEKPSKEATAKQIALAKRQGEAYAAALDAMNKESGVQTRRAGEVEVAVAVEKAEGLWAWRGGKLTWLPPTNENAHVEVAIRDGADGRFLPGFEVTVTLEAPDGAALGTHSTPFLWHPWLFHYGRNWAVPTEGDYRVRVHVEPPEFMRHDHDNGCRYQHPVDVEFTVHIKPGQKRAATSKE